MTRRHEVRRSKLLRGVLPVLVVLQLGAGAGYAAPPSSTLPPGVGKYIMVLWPAGSPIPAGGPPVSVKKVPEPDVAQMGGQVLAKADNLRLILLPLAAAAELRRHEAVVYLQRVWTGESLAGWNESYQPPPGPRRQVAPQDDTNLQWGPKAYAYDGSGNIKSIGADQYTYDSAGRLIQAVVGGTTESYKYDAYGNLIEKAVAGTNAVTVPVDGESNRIEGVPYDAAGNATTAEDGRRTYKYDSLNMVTRVQSPTNDQRLIYDADDERIGTINAPPDTLSRWTIRDFEGRILREYKGSGLGAWTWESDYFYGESSLMGGETEEWGYTTDYRYGGRRHYHLDHLGSVRMVTTDASGASRPRSIGEHDYYPFGRTQTHTFQEQINWGDPHMDAMRFAGHWRDFLGGINVDNAEYLDYMHARYYDPNLGRFLSVDPLPWIDWQNGDREARAKFRNFIANPQNFNMYSYVRNNPMNRTDPTGMAGCQAGDKSFDTCTIKIVYDPKTSNGTLTVTGQNKGDETSTVLLTSSVVVGGDGHVTPTGTFTASVWEKDHVSTKYGSFANTPFSKTLLGGNAFGPYQLHIKELDSRGIYIHGTMGPSWSPVTWGNRLLSPTSHGCVRMCNADDVALHNMMPDPKGNKIIISTQVDPED